jgi:hypothetical protein
VQGPHEKEPKTESVRFAHANWFACYSRAAQVERKWNKGRDQAPVCQRCGKSGHFLLVYFSRPPSRRSISADTLPRVPYRTAPSPPAGLSRIGSAETDEAGDAQGLFAGRDAEREIDRRTIPTRGIFCTCTNTYTYIIYYTHMAQTLSPMAAALTADEGSASAGWRSNCAAD